MTSDGSDQHISETKTIVSKVLVVGGGIAGIQSALDLAESGFKVYLLDKSPSIGGTMAQLDKTFPTNDCAMCIMSPKLVDAGRHPNIELLTYSKLESIKGEAGNFKVSIRKLKRYVDLEKCTGCGECEEACPVELSSEFDEGLSKRHAIYRLYPQAIPNVYTIDKLEGKSPCKTACPAEVNAQGYVQLIGQKKFKEALDLIRERNPFPAICGRVCHHPCEEECLRKEIDEPIAIRALKRFVADWELSHYEKPSVAEKTKPEKVAVIGSGPAGLTCAYYLTKLGYPVTVFEELPVPGGMLAVGIPEYRLPRKTLQAEIEYIKRLGVEIKLNTKIENLTTLKGYNAVFIAVGAHESRKLNVPGEELKGVTQGVSFLRDLNLGKKVKVGSRVAIIGGGNVAIDSARSALRIGAKEVLILYRRSRAEMPANEWEIQEAEEEGVKINYLVAPKRILDKNEKVVGIECIKMELGAPDESGRRKPVPIKGTEFVIDVDMVIPAVGQYSEQTFLKASSLELTEKGTVRVVPEIFATSQKGIFSGGDVVRGPATVVEAIADGRQAALSIDRYLRGESLEVKKEEPHVVTIDEVDTKGVTKKERMKIQKLSVNERKNDFREIEVGLSEQQAIEEAKRCLSCSICSECLQCVEACEADAIDHKMQEKILELNVGSIILSPGFDEFDPKLKSEYGHGRFPNVVSSIEFERILSASGPSNGHVLRQSDQKEPKRIAWIQCVGSRDSHINKGCCSSVCCMYAVKEAVIAKEHLPQIEPTIFYMDIRAYGKDFDKYIERAEKNGVKFIRSRVSHVSEDPVTHNLQINYETEDGQLVKEEFDMAVLSVGLNHPKDARDLAEKFGIDLNEYDFALTKPFDPLKTSRPGIYVAGAFSGPMDIPETVAQASGAAAEASCILSEKRGEHVTIKEYPPEIDVRYRGARIGVFICHCGTNIGGYVDILSVVDHAKKLPHVVYAEDNMYTCSQDTQEHIQDMIKEHNLTRVVVASCTPRTHEPLFQDTIRKAGLNPYLFEMANIRDQCSWVHMKEPEKATEKAKDLIRMAVAKAAFLKPLPIVSLNVTNRGLVIGSGLSGMIASLKLASEGYEVYLVEKTNELGGNLRDIYYTLEGGDVQLFLKELIQKVKDNKKIHLFIDSEIENVSGFVGNFVTTIRSERGSQQVEHGIIIVATGAQEYKPEEYMYSQNKRVITQRELERRIANGMLSIGDNENVVMIQCVGSRDDGHPYCSRVCCSEAIKNALKIKEINGKANVYILYRDIRTYGFKEDYYQKAREKGVIFIHYETEKKPVVKEVGDKLVVTAFDQLLNEEIIIEVDILALSVSTVPLENNEQLAQMLKVPLNEDGFFLEAHMKLRPVDFSTDGIFLAGMAHAPKFIEESISQANAAVSRACTILSKDHWEVAGIVAKVNEIMCRGCGFCVEACPYDAIKLKEVTQFGHTVEIAEVNESVCKGCGACSAACLNGAISHLGFTDGQILAMIGALGGIK